MAKKMTKKETDFVLAVINGIPTRVRFAGDDGGRFFTSEDGCKTIDIQRYDSWNTVVSVFLHEVTEMTAAYLGLRLYKNRMHTGSDAACFFWTHEEFSEVMAISGEVMAKVLPELAALYKKARREKK